MRIDTRPRKRNAPRPAEKAAPGFLQWLRGRDCYLANHRLGGCGVGSPPRRAPVEAAHTPHKATKGTGTKSSDSYAIPMCQRHHDEQGGTCGSFGKRGGWATFQAKYGFDAAEVANSYWKAWPGRIAWERKLEANDAK